MIACIIASFLRKATVRLRIADLQSLKIGWRVYLRHGG